MAALPPPPDGINLNESRKATLMATGIGTWLVAAITVVLRLVSRRMKHVELWIDDWLIVAALVPACAHCSAVGIYAVSRGLGLHVWAAPPDARKAWAIQLYIGEIGYPLTIAFVKWSILAFYWRSFKIRSSIKIPIYVLAVIVLMWVIAVTLIGIFGCQPIDAAWRRFDPAHPLQPDQYKCNIDFPKFVYGNAIPTIVTDVLMLTLPLPHIARLQLPRGQKWALIGVFLVGLFVTVTSIVRLYFLIGGNLISPDITWNFVDVALWTMVEGNTAIFCACLPFLRPVLSKFTFGVLSLSSVPSKKQQHSSGTLKRSLNHKDAPRTWQGESRYVATTSNSRAFNASKETDEHPFARLTDDGSERSVPVKEGLDGSQIELENLSRQRDLAQPNGIVITREIHLQHQDG